MGHNKAQIHWLAVICFLTKQWDKIDYIEYILLSKIEQSVERAAGDIVVNDLQS